MVVLLVLAFLCFAVATIAILVTGGKWSALAPLGLALWVASELAPHVGLH